jgi:hypothetical protein
MNVMTVSEEKKKRGQRVSHAYRIQSDVSVNNANNKTRIGLMIIKRLTLDAGAARSSKVAVNGGDRFEVWNKNLLDVQ